MTVVRMPIPGDGMPLGYARDVRPTPTCMRGHSDIGEACGDGCKYVRPAQTLMPGQGEVFGARRERPTLPLARVYRATRSRCAFAIGYTAGVVMLAAAYASGLMP